MKILVIGLGSMGKRRINLLKNHFDKNYEIIGIDAREDRRLEVGSLYTIETYADLDLAIEVEKPDCVLICTSPSSHSNLIMKALAHGLHVFTEINLLSDKYDEIISLAKNKSLKIFLSSTLIYRKETQYIQQTVSESKDKFHYRYHVGQYLPDWHPWENYKDFFVGNKETNGCRELFAIDLPWIMKAFGPVENIHVVKDKISSLDLDYPDSYIVTFEHEDGHKGTISVDVVSRKAIRSFEMYSEKEHIFWEGKPDSLCRYSTSSRTTENINPYVVFKRDSRYADNIIEDAYLDELKTFFNFVEKKSCTIRYTFEEDFDMLNLIDEIEGRE